MSHTRRTAVSCLPNLCRVVHVRSTSCTLQTKRFGTNCTRTEEEKIINTFFFYFKNKAVLSIFVREPPLKTKRRTPIEKLKIFLERAHAKRLSQQARRVENSGGNSLCMHKFALNVCYCISHYSVYK